jgi:Tfp pilus assembly protein PilF
VTLVQVLANETSLHMSCDFCLTDYYTGKVLRNNAFKLVTVTSPSMLALIGVTGVGDLEGKLIGTWIEDVVGGLGGPRSIEGVLDALACEAEEPLSRIASADRRRHTFVVGSVIGAQTRVSLVSNFEVFKRGRIKRFPTAAAKLTVSSVKPEAPQFLAAGSGADHIYDSERSELEVMLRSGSSEDSIQERLSEINAEVSRRLETIGDKSVSKGCYAASLDATGQGSSRSFLTGEEKGDIIPPEVDRQLRLVGAQLIPATKPDGTPASIQVTGSTLVKKERSAQYFREQRKLQGNNADFWNDYGAFLEDRRKFDEAMDAYKRAMALDPSNAWAVSNLARQHWLHRRELAEADRLYTEAARVAGPNARSLILSDFAAFCDEGLGDADRAWELHERALVEGGEPLVKARLALFLMNHGQEIGRANSLMTAALAEGPNDVWVLTWAAEADWLHKHDHEAARTKLEKACTQNPRDPRIWRFTGDMCLVSGDGSSAAYYYRKAMKRGASGWEIQSAYGLALLMARKPDGALRQLSKARRAAPEDPVVLVNIAATLWTLRRDGEAAASMRKVLSNGLPPEIEIEALAMLRLMSPPATQEMVRLREHIGSGFRGDGTTLRSMAFKRPKQDRELAFKLADIVEGKAALPDLR